MKRYIIISLCVAAAVFSGNAQVWNQYDDDNRWELSLLSGLNRDGWEVDAEIAYFPSPYFGVMASIGMAGELERPEDWYDDWYDTNYYAARFKFTPSVVLRSPSLGSWKSGQTTLHLFVNPGFILSPGASGSHNARVTCWDFKTGFTLKLGAGRISLGYNVSNFALYSGYPYSAYLQPDKDNYNTHSVFVSVGYSF